MALSQQDHEAFMAKVATTLRDGLKLKLVMIKRDLSAAQAKCPECPGMLQGRLCGPKKHMRFWCTGSCKRQMME